MTNRTLSAALFFACAAIPASAQFPEGHEPAPLAAITVSPQEIQAAAAVNHGPSLVAYCQCGGLVSSTGNLYFTSYGINEFGPSSASFYRTGKYSAPGSEGLLYGELGPPYFNYGNVVWALVGGTYYGYFVANYDRSGVRISQIKRVPLAGGAAVILAQSPAYIGVGDLATDGATLFWNDAGGIRRMPINGGPIQTLVASTTISHMFLDPYNVYYSQGAVIGRVSKTGAPSGITYTAANTVTALYVWTPIPAFPVVFWGEHGGAVRSAGVQGTYLWQAPIPGRDVTSVGYDGSRALWTDCSEPGNSQCNLKIQSGGVQPLTVNAGVGAGHLQWDSASVYWTGVPGVQRYVY